MITFKAKDKSGEIFNSALTPFTFPAGEAHIKREDRRELEDHEIAILQFTPESMAQDLMHLAMWADYLRSENTKTSVVLPYFPAARADRGYPFGLGVYLDFLNSMYFDQVIVFDPHSEALVREAERSYEPYTYVYSDEFLATHFRSGHDYAGVIAPDKGAAARTQAVADVLNVPMFQAGKTRNEETGKLTGFECEPLPEEGRFLVVDDICDGGGTFIGLSQSTGLPKERLDLYVSHGVFSGKALITLPQAYENIFTTNSYNPLRKLDVAYKSFKRANVTSLLLDKIK